jgi:hypothetical protein
MRPGAWIDYSCNAAWHLSKFAGYKPPNMIAGFIFPGEMEGCV